MFVMPHLESFGSKSGTLILMKEGLPYCHIIYINYYNQVQGRPYYLPHLCLTCPNTYTGASLIGINHVVSQIGHSQDLSCFLIIYKFAEQIWCHPL